MYYWFRITSLRLNRIIRIMHLSVIKMIDRKPLNRLNSTFLEKIKNRFLNESDGGKDVEPSYR